MNEILRFDFASISNHFLLENPWFLSDLKNQSNNESYPIRRIFVIDPKIVGASLQRPHAPSHYDFFKCPHSFKERINDQKLNSVGSCSLKSIRIPSPI